LKNEVSTPQQKKFETNGTPNKKNIKCNDGLSAVHVPIKQELNGSGNLQVFNRKYIKTKVLNIRRSKNKVSNANSVLPLVTAIWMRQIKRQSALMNQQVY